jgi:ribosomal protein S18 acetylase RimI-like enzyme
MKSVISHDDLERAMREVTRRGAGYSTSFFAPPEKIVVWADAGKLYVLRSEDALLILREDGDLLRIHHITSSPLALRAALAKLIDHPRNRPLVADLVGRPQDLLDVQAAYQDSGFHCHARLDRMQYRGIPSHASGEGTGAVVAVAGDAASIYEFMVRWLDPFSEQIQTREEVAAIVAAGKAMVVRDGDALAGFLIFETTGLSTVLRYWHVMPNCRGRGVGARLMRAFLSRFAESRRIVLWVLANNADAIAKYEHYGYQSDGVEDRIMIRQD